MQDQIERLVLRGQQQGQPAMLALRLQIALARGEVVEVGAIASATRSMWPHA